MTLLLDERLVAVQPSLVRALRGAMNDAAVLQQVHYNLERSRDTYDDHTWWPARYVDLAAETGLSTDQCRRAVEHLMDRGLLVSCQPEGHNRTKWYRIDYVHPTLSEVSNRRARQLEVARTPVGSGARASSSLSPETKTADGSASAPSRTKKRTRARTGRDDLFDALVRAFGKASTPARERFYGKTVTELVAANATPAQVDAARIEMSRRGWATPTPEAMVKHWDDLLTKRPTEQADVMTNRAPDGERQW